MPKYVHPDEVRDVLIKLGIDPASRMDDLDQDPEYTTCRLDEIDDYFRLYRSDGANERDRAVLCCFLIESLNEAIAMNAPHPSQSVMLESIVDRWGEHSDEIAYWTDVEGRDPDDWWPISRALIALVGSRRSS